MPIVKDLAQILRIYEHGNSSQILVLLGRRLGQMRVLVKGARRFHKQGFEGGFDLLSCGEILAYPRPDEALWIFKEWEERDRPERLGRSWASLRAGSYLCELTEALTRETAGGGWASEAGEEFLTSRSHSRRVLREHRAAERAAGHPADPLGSGGPVSGAPAALFDLLACAADALSRGAEAGPLLLSFTLRALDLAGLLPDLAACSACGRHWLAQAGRSDSGTTPVAERPPAARLSFEGLECERCVMRQARDPEHFTSERPPTRSAPSVPERAGPGAGQRALPLAKRGQVWLTLEALRALLFIKRAGRGVKLSRSAADASARALIILVHGALERDLRTLRAAAWEVFHMEGRSRD